MAKPKISFLMILPPVIFAALAGMFFVGMQRENPNEIPSTFIGRDAPAFTEQTLQGFTAPNSEMLAKGQVTLVNFWASWCPPCRAEHPKLLELAGEGISIIGVNIKDDATKATKYLTQDGNPFSAVGFDPKGHTAINWGVTAPPETFIVDGTGKIVYKFTGPLVGSDYDQRFLPQLNIAMGKE